MKTPSDELFLLVKALNKSEVSHFRAFCLGDREERKPLHLRFFDLIYQQKSYDEDKIIGKLNISRKGHISTLKNKLQAMLLQSLNDYYCDLDIPVQIQKLIQSARIMMEKKSDLLAEKLLEKARKLALENDCYEHLLTISSLELILARSNTEKIGACIDQGFKEKEHYLEQLENIQGYQELSGQAYLLYLQHSATTSARNQKLLDEIARHPLLESPEKATNYLSLRNYYYTHFLCSHRHTSQRRQAFLRQKEWIRYLENDKSKLLARKMAYLDAINLMVMGDNLEETEHFFKKAFNFVQTLPPHEKDKNVISNLARTTINYMESQLKNHNAGPALEAWESLQGMSAHPPLTARMKILLNVSLLFAHFLKGDFREALQYCNRVLAIRKVAWIAHQEFARFAWLMIYYELRKMDALPYAVRSVQHYLKNQEGELSEYDKTILSFFKRRLPEIADKKEEKKVFSEWKEALLALPRESVLYLEDGFFDFLSWIESKAEQRPFIEILKQKAGQKQSPQ